MCIRDRAYGELSEQRIGLHHPAIAPYGAYECANGELILIAVQNQREWRRLCDEVLKTPELADDSRVCDNVARLANRSFLDKKIKSVLSKIPRSDTKRLLTKAKIAFGAVNTIEDVSRHPALRLVNTRISEGEIQVMAPPARAVEDEDQVLSVPSIGQHTESIWAEFSTK